MADTVAGNAPHANAPTAASPKDAPNCGGIANPSACPINASRATAIPAKNGAAKDVMSTLQSARCPLLPSGFMVFLMSCLEMHSRVITRLTGRTRTSSSTRGRHLKPHRGLGIQRKKCRRLAMPEACKQNAFCVFDDSCARSPNAHRKRASAFGDDVANSHPVIARTLKPAQPSQVLLKTASGLGG